MVATKTAFCCITALLLYMTTVCYSRTIVEEKHLSDETDSDTGNKQAAKSARHLPYALRLCAFNIKTFGKSKMSDTEVANMITQVIK